MILSSLFFSLSLIRRFLLFFKSFARSHSCLFLSFSPFPLRSLLSLSSSFSTRGYLCSRFALIFFSLAAISTLFVSLSLSPYSFRLSVETRSSSSTSRIFADLPPPDTRGRG